MTEQIAYMVMLPLLVCECFLLMYSVELNFTWMEPYCIFCGSGLFCQHLSEVIQLLCAAVM